MVDKDPYDDLETDYLEEESESGLLSLMSLIIGFLAVAGFIALAWYAYRSSTSPALSDDVETIHAEQAPVRTTPQDPGGWQFPHQEKSVYNVISGDDEKPKAEQILPKPEEPVKREGAATETWMNKDTATTTVPPTDAERVKEQDESTDETPLAADSSNKAEEAKPMAPPLTQEDKVSEEKVSVSPSPIATPAKPAEKPAISKAKPVDTMAVKEEPKAKAEEKAKPAPKPVASANGNYRIQLGAFKSEAEAQADWAKIEKKIGGTSGHAMNVERADLGAKGVYYRLQLKGYASMADAKTACSKISASGQGCYPVKP